MESVIVAIQAGTGAIVIWKRLKPNVNRNFDAGIIIYVDMIINLITWHKDDFFIKVLVRRIHRSYADRSCVCWKCINPKK
jgi:hypothetical protein